MRKITLVGAFAVATAAAAAVQAAPVAWTGATSSSFADDANWGTGAAGSAPTVNDTAVFNLTTYPNQPTIDLNTVQAVKAIQIGDGTTAAAALTLGSAASATSGQITNGNTATASNSVTLVDASGLKVGELVTGSRIQAGTYITDVTGNVVTLSRPTSGGQLNSGSQLTFTSVLKVGSDGVTVNSGLSVAQTITGQLTLTSNQQWTVNSTVAHALTVSGGGINLDSYELTLKATSGTNDKFWFKNNNSLNGAGSLVIDTGTSTVTFGDTGAIGNTFTGGTTLKSGTLIFNGGNTGGSQAAAGLGTGTFTINGGTINGAGNIAGHAMTVSNQIWNVDWTYLGSKQLDMGTGGISLGATAGSTRTLTVNGTSPLLLNGAISNGTNATPVTNFTKAGVGILSLGAANQYTGTTSITGGKLVLAAGGSLASSTIDVGAGTTFDVAAVAGGFTLGSNQTLKGLGTVNGATTIGSNATLSPGASPGIIAVTGDLTLAADSNLAIELNGATVGTQYDQANVTGGVSVSGLLNATLGFAPTLGQNFFIINNDLIDPVGGSGFSNLSPTNTIDLTFNSTAYRFAVSYVGDSSLGTIVGGNDVVLTSVAIPEPATLSLVGLASLGMLARRRRAR